MSEHQSGSRLTALQEVGRAWWVRLAVPVVLILGAGVIAGLRLNVSGSLPVGLYLTVGDASSVKRGSTVIVCLPPEWARFGLHRRILGPGDCEGGSYGLGKIVLAVGGDVVDLYREGLSVNGDSVPNSRSIEQDRYGRVMPRYPWGEHVLRPGEVWLFSPYHPAAFDSRYFGPVRASNIRSVVRPVLTTSTELNPTRLPKAGAGNQRDAL